MYALTITVTLAVSIVFIASLAKTLKARQRRLTESVIQANLSMSELQVQYSQ